MFVVISLLKRLCRSAFQPTTRLKSRPKRLVLMMGLLLSLSAHAELPVTVVSALKAADIPTENVAVYVQAVKSSGATLSHNADKSMNPASVMKLVTTNAALDLLTPAYRWKTEVYRDGDVVNGVLLGNLMIKGYGDPSFKAQDFWRM
jgi:D-alanyl-D-alanine carboxypeptidase/D-alanyl-D-alanine-endopeptidase (penicillin-binding protein 4)